MGLLYLYLYLYKYQLHKEMVAVCCDNYTVHISTVCGQNE